MNRISQKKSMRLFSVIEVERLRREGATLKNVAENLRTIAIIVTMLLVTGWLVKVPIWIVRIAAVLWGAWTLTYAILAALQAGFLFVLVICQVRSIERVLDRYSLLRRSVICISSAIVACFMIGALVVLNSSNVLTSSH